MLTQPTQMDNEAGIIGFGMSRSTSASEAVTESFANLDIKEICFVLVFVPETLNPHDVAEVLNEVLPSTPAFGCTTAGQITPLGYEETALLVIAFPKRHFHCSSTLITPLNPISIEKTALEAETLANRFRKTANWNRIALTIADGLSKQEDILAAALEAGLPDIPVFGGSAAHGLAFDETFVLYQGAFHTNAALLILIDTDLAFRGLGFDHFLPTDKQMVVTDANPEERLVWELNGSAAAREYARLVGCDIEDLSPQVFAQNPVLVRNGNAWHVRAIQQVVDGKGLSFLSAIDDGLLLTLGRGKAILETLENGLMQANRSDAGETPDLILGFDCILRKLEIEQNQLVHDASEILKNHHVLGFNTYGEQHLGVHVNQTFVGVAFYAPVASQESAGLF